MTAGDARVQVECVTAGVRVVVHGRGERVLVTGWSARSLARADRAPVDHDPSTGIWTTAVDVADRGWTAFVLHP